MLVGSDLGSKGGARGRCSGRCSDDGIAPVSLAHGLELWLRKDGWGRHVPAGLCCLRRGVSHVGVWVRVAAVVVHAPITPWDGRVVVGWEGGLDDGGRRGDGEGVGEDGGRADWQLGIVLVRVPGIHCGHGVFLYDGVEHRHVC